MPKLPVIKAKDLIKILNKIGFLEHRQKGSHLILKHNDGRRVIVAIHTSKDIPVGTLKAILKDMKLSVDDLSKHL